MLIFRLLLYCVVGGNLLHPSAQNQQTVVRLAKRRQTKGLRKNLVFILIHIPPSKMRTRIVGCQRGMEIETYSNSFLANKTKTAKRNIYEIRKENHKRWRNSKTRDCYINRRRRREICDKERTERK